MGFRDRIVGGRAQLAVELLEDRTTPAKLDDALSLALPQMVETGVIGDRVNVVMASQANSATDAARLSATPFAESVKSLGFGIYRVTLTPGTDLGTAVAFYGQTPGVVSASPDMMIQVQATPNDTYYSYLYGMTKIGAPTAWDTTTGDSNFVVAVIDTGVDYNHPDLAANMWVNPNETAGNGIDDDGNGIVDDIYGADFANDDGNPMDDNGHGTHVAGTIGAIGNNSRGVVGVNWSVKIMALKFLSSSGSGAISDAIAALNYAVDQGVKVSNNSWGGGSYSSAMATAIDRAQDEGHIFVAAAGNNGASSSNYPALYGTTYDNVVSVAATDSNDALASFSNYSSTNVMLAAPGVSIASTTPNNGYAYMSGTSMAAPHVAGAIALFWSENPDYTYSEVIDKLKDSVDVISGLNGKVATGGRLNVAKMLEVTSPPTVAPGPKVTAATFNGSSSTNINNLKVTFDRSINPDSFTSADIVSFTGPNGAISTSYTITPITGTNNTQFNIGFASQTTAGTYSLTFGPNITDTSGNAMNQNGNDTAGETTADRYTATGNLVLTVSKTFSSTPNTSIPDRSTRTVTMTISDDISITDLNARVQITHTYVGDLVIKLKGPDGTTVTLFNRRGGSGNNAYTTTFDDEASTAISSGSAPFNGSYRPEGALSAFDGKSTKGTWTLTVQDAARYDTGTLYSWSLLVTGTVGGSSGSSQVKALGFLDDASFFDDSPTRFAEPIVSLVEPIREAFTSAEPRNTIPSSFMTWLPGESIHRNSAPLPEVSNSRSDRDAFESPRPEPRTETRDSSDSATVTLYFAPEDSDEGEDGFEELT